jgi:O-antigen/teichoic acid export membrane protein
MILPVTRRRLAINIASNYANIVLMALITLWVVPVYVQSFDNTQWAIVALCLTLHGSLFSIDGVLGPLMLREVARAAVHDRQHLIYLRFLSIYGSTAFIVFALAHIVLLGLQSLSSGSSVPVSGELALAVRIVLVQFLFLFANNAAIGYWYGQEQQRFANRRVAGFILAKHALALLLVTQWSATAVTYLISFATVSVVECLVNVHRVLTDMHARDDFNTHKQKTSTYQDAGEQLAMDWRGLIRLAVPTGIGVLTAQVDRIYLSMSLPAEQYGIYYLISSLMLSLLQLQVPISRAFLPRIATAESPLLAVTAMRRVSLGLLTLPSLALALFPDQVLTLWLHNPQIASTGAPTLRLMLIAAALIAIYAPTSALLFNRHRYGAIMLVNGLVLLAQTALLIGCTENLGMMSGGLSWLGCGLIQLATAVYIREPGHTPAPDQANTRS